MANVPRDMAPLTSTCLGVLGACLIALGVFGVVAGDFAFQWQPVAAWIPARQGLATVFGLLEVGAGLLMMPAGSRRLGAAFALIVLSIWTALHVQGLIRQPGSMAEWLGLAEPAAITSALAMSVPAGDAPKGPWMPAWLATAAFGLSAMIFGASHWVYADFTASMVPAWLPFRLQLAYVTGACHMLAGLAIALNVVRGLAAGLEALMMFSFVAFVHVPRVLVHAGSRMEWTMMMVAVMLTVSALVVMQQRGKAVVSKPAL